MAVSTVVSRRALAARLVVPALVVAYGVATAVLIAGSAPVPISYASASGAATAADLTAGLGLLVVGIAARLQRRSGVLGALAILAGTVWLAADWVGWEDGWAIARSLGMLAAPFLAPLLVQLALALPTGRLPSRTARRAVGALYALTGVYALARALLDNPFLDLDCWNNCSTNVFLIAADQNLVRTLQDAWLWITLALGASVAAVALGRLLAATRAARAATWPALLPLAAAGCAEAAYAIALMAAQPENPDRPLFMTVFLIRALALASLAGGIAWTLTRAARTSARIARLADELGAAPAPGSLQAALARSLGDDSLEVAYWLPDTRRYVDHGARPVDPRHAGPGRAMTSITRGGEPVALVLHDRALYDSELVERELGPAARLAVDNERLRAQTLARLADLKAARARIVRAGDAERTRLERDLHDGAQQGLLALSYDLRLAATAGDAQLGHTLAGAIDTAGAALTELREIAHGIHPAILSDAGLAPALETFADRAPLPLELDALPSGRYPAPVEKAAYLVVTAAAADAARRGADWVRIRVRNEAGSLIVEASGDAAPGLPAHIVDRVGALGGRVHHAPRCLTVKIPCA